MLSTLHNANAVFLIFMVNWEMYTRGLKLSWRMTPRRALARIHDICEAIEAGYGSHGWISGCVATSKGFMLQLIIPCESRTCC